MNNKQRLTSSEITGLWTQYIQNTMSTCISKHVLATAKDPEILSLFKFTLNLSHKHLEMVKDFFKSENIDLPNGFTENDVHLNAPALFTDNFWLIYIHDMTLHGLSGYTLSFSNSARKDVRNHFYQCNIDTMDLYNKSIEVLLDKGIYQRSPYFSTKQTGKSPTQLTYIMDSFGDKRPLNTMEAGNIYFNLKKSIVTKTLLNGFKQVIQDKEILKFMEQCSQTIHKNISIFTSLFEKENLHSPNLLDGETTNSVVAPFSERLMTFHIGFLFHLAATYYTTAMITSMRIDILGHCDAAILRDLKTISLFGKLMIKKGWMEQLPEADDRTELA
ncbi:DUF3231 family protein [Cytobacillus oceanisediminis]|uniref:DUF3231 family protein n=1 Tax=Cytobacillus oceanisediminis TaxID=665099 RepID=UPI001CCBDF21|nr:DUF3231 family protein [Cytobacillus oceanisediminis]MBQ6448203.1 DUF3231 family protein [Bacillus sp. (in: firmicutes)]MBZ9536187.1 DUF3231 family protein [Cytobacillus oceanisediminis]